MIRVYQNKFKALNKIVFSTMFSFSIASVLSSAVFAQRGVSPYYEGAASYAGRTFVVPTGTTFEGRIESTIGSTVSKQGSIFTIRLTSPILANGSDVLIPAGALIEGEVVQAIPASEVPHVKHEKSVGKLRVQITQLKMPDGMTYPIIASLVGEEAIANSMFQAGNVVNPVRGSGVAYVGTPTGFQLVTPGRAQFNPRTGAVRVITRNEMLNDPIMGQSRETGTTSMRSLVKKNRNLFIYEGSPLTVRLDAPLKLGVKTSAGEESALMHSGQFNQSPQPGNAPPQVPGNTNQRAPFIPKTQPPMTAPTNDSNF